MNEWEFYEELGRVPGPPPYLYNRIQQTATGANQMFQSRPAIFNSSNPNNINWVDASSTANLQYQGYSGGGQIINMSDGSVIMLGGGGMM